MSDEPRYELVYFDIRGRAEQIRLIFAYAGVEYVDTAIDRNRWSEEKKNFPLGQVPVLYERSDAGELLIPQSLAIVRHLGRAFDLYGAGEPQRVQCDVVIDTVAELRARFNEIAFYPNFLRDEEVTQRYFATTFPAYLDQLETLHAAGAEAGHGYFVGESVTIADLVAFDTLDAHLEVRPACLDGREELARFMKAVIAQPAVAGYLARRRGSDFER